MAAEKNSPKTPCDRTSARGAMRQALDAAQPKSKRRHPQLSLSSRAAQRKQEDGSRAPTPPQARAHSDPPSSRMLRARAQRLPPCRAANKRPRSSGATSRSSWTASWRSCKTSRCGAPLRHDPPPSVTSNEVDEAAAGRSRRSQELREDLDDDEYTETKADTLEQLAVRVWTVAGLRRVAPC